MVVALALLPFRAAAARGARPLTLGRAGASPTALLGDTDSGGPLAGALPADFELPRGGKSVILFDGVCNFCNAWVSLVLDNDPDGLFCFASMQSDVGRELLAACGRSADDLSTFVVVDSEGFFTRSTAALRVAKTLPKPALNAAAAAIVAVPAPLRDAAYLLVAKNRYRLLGRDADGATPSCQLRAPDEMERFL